MGVSPRRLRDVMGRFATGVAIVTTAVDDELHGMTVNSLTSVSLDPPLLLVCFTEGSRTAKAVQERGAFVVNLLSGRQRELSEGFARRGADHFAEVQAERARDGLPFLPGGLGHLVCDVEAVHPGGDHVIVVGRVVKCAPRDAAPLVFYRGKYHALRDTGREAHLDWYW